MYRDVHILFLVSIFFKDKVLILVAFSSYNRLKHRTLRFLFKSTRYSTGTKLALIWYYITICKSIISTRIVFYISLHQKTKKMRQMENKSLITTGSKSNMTFEYSGIYYCGLAHYSKGFDSASEAHDYVINMCKERVASKTAIHSFRVAKCVYLGNEEYDYKVVYSGKVMKTKIEYTFYNYKEEKKVVYLKSKLNSNSNNISTMKQFDYFSDSEIMFLNLSVEAVKNIASECVKAVVDNYESNDDDAVQMAVSKASNRLVVVSATNKVGKKTEGHVCLNMWDLYGKTHCNKFFQLPHGSKAYNRVNGTIKIENLEEKILEVHTNGNELLNEIHKSETSNQAPIENSVASHEEAAPIIVADIATPSVSSTSLELTDADVYVNRLVRRIHSYIITSDEVRDDFDVLDISSYIESKSNGLFTATIDDKEITIVCPRNNSSETVSIEAAKDISNGVLYSAIANLLINLSFTEHTCVASIVEVKTLIRLNQILLKNNSLCADTSSLPNPIAEDCTPTNVNQQMCSTIQSEHQESNSDGHSSSTTIYIPQYSMVLNDTLYKNVSFVPVATHQMR